jgi:CAAX prenyl protease-like protein
VTAPVPTLPYWLPMVVFGVLTLGESRVPQEWFAPYYLLKAVIVTATLLIFSAPLRDIQPRMNLVAPSIAVGVVVFVLWVVIHEWVPYPQIGSRSAFDPTPLQGSGWWPAFLAVRLYGLVLMVPVMEEIFWRSFLVRYLTNPDFWLLPMGTFSASALWLMVGASAVAHPEWVVAIIASLAYAFWLRRTKSLFAVIVAHGVTNAILGGYVLATGKWSYW